MIERSTGTLHGLLEDSFAGRLAIAAPVAMFFFAACFGRQLNLMSMWSQLGVLLGNASYSLYLVHPFALRGTRAIWIKLIGADVSIWVFYIVSLTLAVFAGLTCYFIVERPITRYFAGAGKAKERPALKTAAEVPVGY